MDWSHSFCLACDRQTEGSVYCSEACRIAEYEVPSSTGSAASSPTSPRMDLTWERSRKNSNPSLMAQLIEHATLSHPYEIDSLSSSSHSIHNRHTQSLSVSSKSSLTPASSNSTLYGLQNTPLSIHTDISLLSEDSKRALQSYANSFDQSRYSRRQSRY